VPPFPPFLPEDGSRANFRIVVFKEKHWTMDKVLKQYSSKIISVQKNDDENRM
jgi:hypothetical protein